MRGRFLPGAIVIGLLFAFGGLMGGCVFGFGGGQLTLEEYFEELEQISKDVDDRAAELEDDFDKSLDAADGDEEEVEAYLTFFDESLAALEDARDDVDGLSPPDEVEAEHGDFVEAADAAVEAFGELIDEAQDADSGSEIDELLVDDQSLADAGEELDDACFALQDIADDEDIDVDLDCGDGDEGEPAATEELPTPATSDNGEQYPPTVIENFLEACTAQPGATDAYCSCAIEEIQKEFSLDEYAELERRLADTGEIPEELAGSIAECIE
ncbi:MAG: hypothetical protein U1B78_03815 [Dehalococcoidia bacterium]|nr:hypothetical protein [Dehalococcoidia bacterium]